MYIPMYKHACVYMYCFVYIYVYVCVQVRACLDVCVSSCLTQIIRFTTALRSVV